MIRFKAKFVRMTSLYTTLNYTSNFDSRSLQEPRKFACGPPSTLGRLRKITTQIYCSPLRNPFWQQVSRRESPYPITVAGSTQPAVGLNSSHHLRPYP